MLRFIDMGELHDPEGAHLHQVVDIREWMVMFRRLFTPHFEEARLYMADAERAGFYSDSNEIWPYIDNNLKLVIEEYGEK
jgi:hypothetical protein